MLIIYILIYQEEFINKIPEKQNNIFVNFSDKLKLKDIEI